MGLADLVLANPPNFRRIQTLEVPLLPLEGDIPQLSGNQGARLGLNQLLDRVLSFLVQISLMGPPFLVALLLLLRPLIHLLLEERPVPLVKGLTLVKGLIRE